MPYRRLGVIARAGERGSRAGITRVHNLRQMKLCNKFIHSFIHYSFVINEFKLKLLACFFLNPTYARYETLVEHMSIARRNQRSACGRRS